jgi:hypothetical protein
MPILPMEMVDEILAFNNAKLVYNKKNSEYDVKIRSFAKFQGISEVYGAVKFHGITQFKAVADYYVKWYEISYKDKWQMRSLLKTYTLYAEPEEINGYLYNIGKIRNR